MSQEQEDGSDEVRSDSVTSSPPEEKEDTNYSWVQATLALSAIVVLGILLYALHASVALDQGVSEDHTHDDAVATTEPNTNNTPQSLITSETLAREDLSAVGRELLRYLPSDYIVEIIDDLSVDTGDIIEFEVSIELGNLKKKRWVGLLEGYGIDRDINRTYSGGVFRTQVYGPDGTVVLTSTTPPHSGGSQFSFETRRSGTWRIVIQAGEIKRDGSRVAVVLGSVEEDDVINIRAETNPDLQDVNTRRDINMQTGVVSVTLYSNEANYFNVNDIDVSSLRLNHVPHMGISEFQVESSQELMPAITLDFPLSEIEPDEATGEYFLEGQTKDGVPIRWSTILGM